MTLTEQTFLLLSEKYPKIKRVSTRPTIWEIDSKKCNIRSASQKSGDKYWFDVTPSLYEKNQVDYFIYICGSPKVIYVFPCDVFSDLIVGAHFGGQKKVPNFTIFDNIAEFEPAGQSHKRKNISKYRNNFSLISAINKDHLKIDFSYPEEVPSNIIEGAKQRITVNSFERSKEAREKCIQHHGYNCTICGFNFLLHYGERGMNFIHVHHIIPISKIAESYIIDPIKDLREPLKTH